MGVFTTEVGRYAQTAFQDQWVVTEEYGFPETICYHGVFRLSIVQSEAYDRGTFYVILEVSGRYEKVLLFSNFVKAGTLEEAKVLLLQQASSYFITNATWVTQRVAQEKVHVGQEG